MTEFTAEERQYLVNALEAAHKTLLRELNHTDSREFQSQLKQQIEMNESLTRKLSAIASAA